MGSAVQRKPRRRGSCRRGGAARRYRCQQRAAGNQADRPVTGLDTDLEWVIQVQREAIPLVFVPGIMGSRLRRNGAEEGLPVMRWDPGDALWMVRNYWSASPAERKALVVGPRFSSTYLRVADDPVGDGLEGIMHDYRDFLLQLRTRSWAPVNRIFEFPVYAVGFNWTADSELSGQQLAARITVPLPQKGLVGVWEDRIAGLRKLPPPAGARQAVIRTGEIMPGAPSVLYFSSADSPGLVALEAMRTMGDHAVIANRGADLDAAQREAVLRGGTNETLERLVRNVLNAYVPTTDRGFCVGYGAIVTPKPGINEDARIMLAHPDLKNFDIRVVTRTVAEPDTRSYSNVDEERQGMGVARVVVLREQERAVAGLPGKELRAAFNPEKQPPFVRFTWHFAGVPGRSEQPAIDVVGIAAYPDRARLESAWEALLMSFRSVPL